MLAYVGLFWTGIVIGVFVSWFAFNHVYEFREARRKRQALEYELSEFMMLPEIKKQKP